MARLADKVALVTGSGQGIGRAIARLMAAEGARVAINDLPEAHSAQKTAAEITAAGGSATPIAVDVSTWSGGHQAVQETIDHFGRLDILVNNAGAAVVTPRRIEDMGEQAWDAVLDVNLKSQVACIAAALGPMRRSGWGRIVNIGSRAGLYGVPTMSAYSAAKGAVHSLTLALAQELAGTGVTMNCVLPSAMSPRKAQMRAERAKLTGDSVAEPEKLPPEAIAPLAVYLASDAAGQVTGQIFYSAGGRISRHAWPPDATTLAKEGIWSLGELETAFPSAFGDHLQPVKVTGG